MAKIAFDIPDALATKINTVAQSRGFPNGKAWIVSLVGAELKASEAAAAMTPYNAAREAAEKAVDTAVKGIS